MARYPRNGVLYAINNAGARCEVVDPVLSYGVTPVETCDGGLYCSAEAAPVGVTCEPARTLAYLFTNFSVLDPLAADGVVGLILILRCSAFVAHDPPPPRVCSHLQFGHDSFEFFVANKGGLNSTTSTAHIYVTTPLVAVPTSATVNLKL